MKFAACGSLTILQSVNAQHMVQYTFIQVEVTE